MSPVEDYHNKRVQALTLKANGRPRQIVCDIEIRAIPGTSIGGKSSLTVKAIWDTGATGSVISEHAAGVLGLQPVGKMPIQGAHKVDIRNRYIIDVIILKNVGISRLSVADAPLGMGVDFLIGMDIMSIGDLAFTRGKNSSVFTFRVPSLEKPIDFGDDIKSYNSAMRQAQIEAPKLRNEISQMKQRKKHNGKKKRKK